MFTDIENPTTPEDVSVSRNLLDALSARDPNATNWINKKSHEYEFPEFKGQIGRIREIASASLDLLYFFRLAVNGATAGALDKIIGEPKYEENDFCLDDFFKHKADCHRFAVISYMKEHGISVSDLNLSPRDTRSLQSIRFPKADLAIV